ncbi:MAG: phage portal protein [Peptostreptococcaceae bacterium]|nr:phage portal protein [Peptostreptococcaceae bacterium]
MGLFNKKNKKIDNDLEKVIKSYALQSVKQIINSGYSYYGASKSKKSLLGWTSSGGSSKEDIEDNIDTLRQRSRDLYMGVPLATGAIKTCRTNVIGGGLKLKSQIDYKSIGITAEEARELEQKIEKEFALWADGTACDIERLDNFYELQQLAFINWLLSGDVIALLPTTQRVAMPYDLRIQLIEADRLSTPTDKKNDESIVEGVESNKQGEVIAYHICNKHPLAKGRGQGRKEWVRVEAYGKDTGRRNVLHLMNRERIGQKRGVPFLAPVIEALKQLGRYTDAELIAAVVSGMLTVFIEKEGYSNERPFGEMIGQEQQVDITDENTIELGAGAIVDLNEGEKANVVNPGRPNTAFDGFVMAICRQIGAALEIPYELLLKNFNASYSASRAALLEAWKMFRMYREWLANDFCQPVYEEWLTEAVAKGRIEANGFFSDPLIKKAYSKAEWNGPAQGLLNPVQEVSAAERRVANGFSTRAKEAKEMNGTDFYRNIDQLEQETKLMKNILNEGEQNGEQEQI